jgi:Rps23 Pro-64 3,4-dihydroxylase Tpa1-like proline 4-hydroxylase
MDLQPNDANAALPRVLMPPYVLLRDVFDEATVSGLLDYALSNEGHFTHTKVAHDGVNPSIRTSLGLHDLGPYGELLKTKVQTLLPALIADLHLTPVEDPKIELELVAHGDGAFYKRHIDTRTGHDPDRKRIRALSVVYYFHAQPKSFTGGALRLFGIGAGEHSGFVDIEPARNSLLAFPSWAPHEVTVIDCPSKQFIHSRFAVNCWFWRRKQDASA